ncbi:MAG: hypothetical protein ACJAYU_004308 [Bradymonadia bacterium]|jgi:hypothetical protein
MELVIAAGVIVLVAAILISRVSGHEVEVSGDELDPVKAFLAAEHEGGVPTARDRQRVLTLGTRVVGPLYSRLLRLESYPLEPAAQLAIEETISDFGVAGVNALVSNLDDLHRRHPAVPATVRIVEQVGAPILPKLSRERRISLELRVLLLRRFVRRGFAVWEIATEGDDSALFIASTIRAQVAVDHIPQEVAEACAALPGDRGPSLEHLMVTAPPHVFSLDRFDRGERNPEDDLHCMVHPELALHPAARARGWGAAEEPTERHSHDWLRWAMSNLSNVRAREALLTVARVPDAAGARALASLARWDARIVCDVLTSARGEEWPTHEGDWLRLALREGGVDAHRLALDRLIRGVLPEGALVGSALAELEVSEHLEALLDGYYRSTGRSAVEIEALIDAAGPAVAKSVTEHIRSDNRRHRRAAIELAGRLGWPVATQLVANIELNPLDTPFVVPALELIGMSTKNAEGASNDEVRRACDLLELLSA